MEDQALDLVILLEDEKTIQKSFEDYFEDNELNLELKCCSSPKEYEDYIREEGILQRLKVTIFDLANTPKEQGSEKMNDYEAVEFIKHQYHNNRIPIFVHSSKLQYFDQLNDTGTVWKISKSDKSVAEIGERIKLMHESEFLNIFSFGGYLEERIMTEIHTAFVNQFKGDEIDEIIKSIQSTSKEDSRERVIEVFERVGIRSVYENWVSADLDADGQIIEKKFNSIEHYYRRTSSYEVWTGDIFEHKENKGLVVILTPRCNVGHDNYKELIVCDLIEIEGDKLNQLLSKKKGEDNLRRHITDDTRITSERYRFLTPSPQFRGGLVDYKLIHSIMKDDLLKSYEKLISLSEELTNDVVRKFTSYMSRGGISETEFAEAHFYIQHEEKGDN